MGILNTKERWQTDHHDDSASLDILLGIGHRLDEVLITSILAHTSHSVHVIDSGLMALESLKRHSFDLCLLSYELADLNGPETTQAIRASSEGWHETPIIGILHHNENLIIAECLHSGMNTFLNAPISAKKLLPLLRYYQEKTDPKNRR